MSMPTGSMGCEGRTDERYQQKLQQVPSCRKLHAAELKQTMAEAAAAGRRCSTAVDTKTNASHTLRHSTDCPDRWMYHVCKCTQHTPVPPFVYILTTRPKLTTQQRAHHPSPYWANAARCYSKFAHFQCSSHTTRIPPTGGHVACQHGVLREARLQRFRKQMPCAQGDPLCWAGCHSHAAHAVSLTHCHLRRGVHQQVQIKSIRTAKLQHM
jgi:hypothetical protein